MRTNKLPAICSCLCSLWALSLGFRVLCGDDCPQVKAGSPGTYYVCFADTRPWYAHECGCPIPQTPSDFWSL